MVKYVRGMMVLAGWLLMAGWSGAAESGGASTSGAPAVTVPACPAPPYLDGALTDACWQSAAVISNFAVFKKPGETVGHQARLAQDGQWLYIALEMLHPAPKHLKQTVFDPDGGVVADDSLEIYLDPGSSNAFYLHYGLNAANIKTDQVVLRDGSRNRATPTPWRSAVQVTDCGWNAELAFPLHVLAYHQKRSACNWSNARINLCVNTVKPVFDPYGARMTEERHSSSWAPVLAGFHEPERFGRLQNIAPDPTTVPARKTTAPLFWPALVSARADQYAVAAGQPGYNMAVLIKNSAYSTGMTEVLLWDRPVAGAVVETRCRQALQIGQTESTTMWAPLKTPGRRTAVVWMNDAIYGGAFDSRLLDEQAMQVTDPFAAWLDRSYYTTEPAALVVCRLRVDEKSMAGQSVVVRDAAGRVVGRVDRLAADCRAPVRLDQFALGTHALQIEWLSADGERLGAHAVELAKLAPKPGYEVKIDRQHGMALRDGTPFFPFGLYIQQLTSQDEEYIKWIAAAGYNVVLWSREADTPPAELQKRLAMAHRHGLAVVDWVEDVQPIPPNMSDYRKGRGRKIYDEQGKKSFSKEEELRIALADFEELLPGLRRTSEVLKQAPNLLSYYSVDEPNLVNPDARIAMAEPFYREVRQADPYRPVWMLYACHVPSGARWTQWSEVLGYDPYVYPGWGRLEYGAPNFVAQQTIELKRRADSVHQAIWQVPVAFQMDPGRTPRGVSAAEQYCQTYLALIHGAKGLVYFAQINLYAQAAWDALSNLARQMQILGPAIVAPAVPQEIVYQPTPLDADKGVFPAVQAALFRHPDGRHILLAANSAPDPVAAVFTVTGLQAPAAWRRLLGARPVKNLFGPQNHVPGDGTFAEELEGYGVRAYVLEMAKVEDGMRSEAINRQSQIGSLKSKIQITVAAHADTNRVTSATVFPVGAIQKRKNHMPNPSFELAAIPGVPDYIRPNMYLNRPLVGAPGAIWGLDTNQPYHGRHCLRLAHQFKGGEPPDMNTRITMGVFYAPILPQPALHTFSLYARAARAGDELSVHFYGMTPSSPGGKWKLTRDWQRYVFTGSLAGGGLQLFNLYTWSKDAVVFVDALQIEAGAVPSEFDAK